MSVKTAARFLDDEEKLRFYSKISKVDMDLYASQTLVKAFVGAEIYIFHFDNHGQLTIDTKLLCSNVQAGERGLKVTYVDQKASKVFTVGDVPNKIGFYDLVSHIPYRCMVERTIKDQGNGKLLQGITATVAFRSKSIPEVRRQNHYQAMAASQMQASFSREEYEAAFRRFQG